MLKLKIIVGSTRPSRFSEKTLPWIHSTLKNHPEFQTEVLDLRDYSLPYFDQPVGPSNLPSGTPYANPTIQAWADKINEADAFLVITPEYNRGYSAVLKNALDVIYHEWANKPIGFISYGSVGGSRAVEQLRTVAIELQMAPIRNSVHIQAPWFLMDEQGNLKDGSLDSYTKSLSATLNNLESWGKALTTLRS
jgi:NAD(P)H-dependent FMN reductase